MGENKPTTRTLESGEKVTHYPDGRQILQQNGNSKLFQKLGTMEDTHDYLDAEKIYGLTQEVEKKKEAMEAGDPIPNDKRPI